MKALMIKLVVVASFSMLMTSVQAHETFELTTSNDGTYIQSFKFSNGQSLVIAEGRIEPRSIGSITIKLFKDLYVGDFTQGIVIPRDGTILNVEVMEDTDQVQKVKITTVTAGSGNYQSSQLICVENNKLFECE
ncbi:PliI family lysozyme inhibitor of I-type lysozyme [Shewanella sp. 1_MG-2023]|uniref:PliI family lysozyme inhibitor of I-type lysozyme n=1 Tax=unclassified Shewanella TaxID=196818 RepID=UPI0026E48B92|nr:MULTISPECIES: PliI family lysozyme inhibitor of I-type lysozyme [unclassified Shewanella]MDO6610941.1 PliI family lysozyme inhibitor of I-type lysozyme [Shewanella sp. 7_MG-2023]MDO6770208.1 PliI family lysozyme inhibitor of I-type lysozyme [Shewanella sp. 2_MG-2023]MDO6793349.1 PliI family lysozyme inhibitor of I-type lysozyme [Shewanella sp. 1_MG-2023]